MPPRSPFPYSLDNKRYHTLHYHNMQTFGGRVWKAALDGGFTCPNIDGTCGTGGCAFCDGGSGAFTRPLPLHEQLDAELCRIRRKEPEPRCIAYFQVHTNTYAPVDRLAALYEEALSYPGIIGLSIGTRPDCLPEEVLGLLDDLNRRTYLTVELGVQTVHDVTAHNFGRGYDFDVFLQGYAELQKRGIRTCLHLIDGLPGEDFDAMCETARVLGKLRPQAVKISLLHILEGTRYAEEYRNGKLTPMTQPDYIRTVGTQLQYLPPETVIERLTGDGEKSRLLAPDWSRDKRSTLGGIDKYLAQENTMQGARYISSYTNSRSIY